MAMVKLQQGETEAAVDFLDNAVEFDRRDLRSLQLMGAVNVVRGSVELGGRYALGGGLKEYGRDAIFLCNWKSD